MDHDILFFFDRHLDALPIYTRLEEQILSRVENVHIRVAKTQITFANKYGFAFVSFTPCRRANRRPPVWLTVSFGLDHRQQASRIDAAVEPYPGRWTHHVMVGAPEEIDDELLGWIQQAARFSASKG